MGTLGFHYRKDHYLYIEEGLYLMESGRLVCPNLTIRQAYESEDIIDLVIYFTYVSLKDKGFLISRLYKETTLPLTCPVVRSHYQMKLRMSVPNRRKEDDDLQPPLSNINEVDKHTVTDS